jgi:hypothetical protein
VLQVCLAVAPRRIRGPFVAPRDLGAVQTSFESSRPSLSVGAPEGPVAHLTLHSTTVKRSPIGDFQFKTVCTAILSAQHNLTQPLGSSNIEEI